MIKLVTSKLYENTLVDVTNPKELLILELIDALQDLVMQTGQWTPHMSAYDETMNAVKVLEKCGIKIENPNDTRNI